MDWQNILITIVSTVLLGVLTWVGERVVSFINSKIKNNKIAQLLIDAFEIVTKSVKATYQTYVEALKNNNAFNEATQTEALAKAKDMILSQLSDNTKEYITSNYGDLDAWITLQIEGAIYDLKK